MNDHPLDKATYTIAITVPKGLEAVSNGALTGKHTEGQHTTWTWNETKPMASYLATATTGQFNLKSYSRDGISFLDAIDPALFRQPLPRTGGTTCSQEVTTDGYKQLSRTFTVPAGGGRLTFHVTRNTESTWDFFAVEGTVQPGPTPGPRCATSTVTRRRTPATAARAGSRSTRSSRTTRVSTTREPAHPGAPLGPGTPSPVKARATRPGRSTSRRTPGRACRLRSA